MAEIDGEQYAARKLGCEISADPLNPLDPIKKVCKSHHPDEDLSILDRAYRRAVIQHSAQRRTRGARNMSSIDLHMIPPWYH